MKNSVLFMSRTRFGHGPYILETAERRGVLTARQQQVAVLVQQGLSNKEIARELRISKGTVKLHVHNILVTVGVRSRREVIVAASPEAAVSTGKDCLSNFDHFQARSRRGR